MDENQTMDHDRIMKINIEEEMKSSYIDYSMSVIVARALPDVRDGFKPVHRRILYGMLGIGNTSDKPYKKCARVVGEVLGKYHPHGDSSVYGALVRMGQEWNMRYTLIDGQGNFGSVDGDSPAAMRYTECRLSKMGEHIMDDLDKETVDMMNNFDDTLQEPSVMPTKIPNLLVNGGNGIAVGMATNIPTHNLGEVIDGCCAYIDNNDIDTDGLMQYIPAPDFPTGATIYGIQGVKDAYETGKGRIVVRATAEIETGENHDKIVITEIPYGVNKEQLVMAIADLAKEGRVDGIANVNDESGRQGMRIVVDVKRDANANVLLNKLFKLTALQSSFSVNCIALVNGRPRLLSLKECVKYFVDHRHDVTIRRTQFELKKAQERAHILEGLIIACDNIDEVVHIIRASKTPSDAQRNLEKRFELDELQSKAIVDMRLSQLTGLRLEQLHNEFNELMKTIDLNCIALVNGRPRLLSLKECVKYFVDHRHDVTIRRTQFELKKAQERAHILEGLIIACDNIDEVVHIIRASKTPSDAQRNLEKRFELDELQSKAIVDMRLSQLTGLRLEQLHNEFNELMKTIDYLNQILNDPELCKKVMKDELNEVKEKYGDARRTMIKPDDHEFNPEDFYPNDPVVITVSHLGYIKRTPLSEFREQARGGVGAKGARTRDKDFTEYIYPATMHQTMLFFTKKGRCYWLKCYEIPEGDRNSKGRAIQNLLNIESDDQVNAFLRLKGLNDAEFINSHYVVFATKNGTVKKTCLEAYSRPRANGVIAINIVEGDEVVDVRLTNGHNELILANRNGRAVRFDENQIRTMGRTSTGVRGMRLDDGDDALIGMIVVNDPEKETVMVVSEQGYGKRSDVVDYRVTNRGGKGVKTLNITEKTGRLVAIKNVTDDNDLMIINQSGIVIRLAVADCRVMGRATQGVRLINLAKKNDVIASVCKVMSSELEASVEEESRSAWAKKSEEIENDTMGAKTAEEVAEAETELENQEDENVQE
jgi:DNA gyrase/topoisomerase IV subunit A